MAQLQVSLNSTTTKSSKKLSSTEEKIKRTLSDELIFGICSPIGSNNEKVIGSLKTVLKLYGYNVKVIKLSGLILEHITDLPESEKGKSTAYTSLMNKIRGGDLLRRKYSPAILADLVIKKIFEDRIEEAEMPDDPTKFTSRRVCYIIDSIKNKKELDLLRQTYQDLFYCFSIFSPREERVDYLVNGKKLNPDEAKELIDTDEYENNTDGQDVRNTFVEADFFIRASEANLKDIDKRIERFMHLIFESQIITPFKHENAMYEAKSAAGNSACMSRQVGACITDLELNILSTGWNDVPKPGGNLYREGDIPDNRCFNKGKCYNDDTKNILTADIVKTLISDEKIRSLLLTNEEIEKKLKKESSSIGNTAGVSLSVVPGGANSVAKEEKALTEIDSNDAITAATTILSNRISLLVRGSTKVRDLIEFSRSVHAEMHAIISGCQLNGTKMIGGKLYCTTYPCHNCARHIVAAGIKEVYYIEPYVKSLSMKLHEDELTESEIDKDGKVKILLYDGVAPRQYLHFFTKTLPRKQSTGQLPVKNLNEYSPKSSISLQAIPTLEAEAINTLEELNYDPRTKIKYIEHEEESK
jgi:deoxycytidylate deaminase